MSPCEGIHDFENGHCIRCGEKEIGIGLNNDNIVDDSIMEFKPINVFSTQTTKDKVKIKELGGL